MRETELLLYGVFRALIARKVPLGVADYLDAIRALKRQHATDVAGELPSRDRLRRLCQILWARNAEELRLVDEVFGVIPVPPQEEVDALAELLRKAEPDSADGIEATTDRRRATRGDVVESPSSAETAKKVAIEIQSARESGGVPLPYPVIPALASESFVLRPQTVVSSRTLAVLWRRYRRMRRTGRPTELDLQATIAMRCRRGLIDRPVLRAPRVNRARLLILADVSPSMAVWRPFLDELAHSLTLSRLRGAELFYFSNVPRQSLFRAPSLGGAVATKRLLDANADTSVLIVSDAGAARGHLNRQRVEKTRAFLGNAGATGRRVVWINPMPEARWTGSSAEALATANATFLPLTVPALIRAVDVLRGAKGR